MAGKKFANLVFIATNQVPLPRLASALTGQPFCFSFSWEEKKKKRIKYSIQCQPDETPPFFHKRVFHKYL